MSKELAFDGSRLARAVGAAIIVVFACTRADAVDGIANNKTGSGWSWTSSQYWYDSEGNSLGTYPHVAGDTAMVLCESNVFRYITIPTMSLAALSGGSMHMLQFSLNTATGAYPKQRLSVDDPGGFPGYIASYNTRGRCEVQLNATEAFSPTLWNYAITGRMGIDVPAAGTSATVKSLFGDGALYATGAGTLTVERTPGSSAILYATTGTVNIVGRATENDADAPVPGAWLHLDASKRESFDTVTKADGFEHVTKWRDADGGAVYAYEPTDTSTAGNIVKTSDSPYIADGTVSPTGLRVIDFGDRYGDSTALGGFPTNCYMRLSPVCKNVREVFYAGQYRTSSVGTMFGDGDGAERYFLTGGATSPLSQNAPNDTKFGCLTVNGQKIPFSVIFENPYGTSMTNFHVMGMSISDGSDAAAKIHMIGSRARIASETGNCRIGEILIYTNHLTDVQRKAVTDYLMAKWLKGAEREDFGAAVLGQSSAAAAISVPEGHTARIGTVTAANGKFVKKGGGVLSVGDVQPATATIEVQGGQVKIREQRTVDSSAPADGAYVWLDAEAQSSVVTQQLDYAHLDPDKYYVTRWNDCRGAGHEVYAETPQTNVYSSYPTNFPTVVDGAANGHRAVDFGRNVSGGKASFMWLQPHGSANACEGFIAFRFNSSSSTCNIFGSSDLDFYRAVSGRLLDRTYGTSDVTAGLWTIDGMAADPWQTYSALNDTSFHVVSFSSRSKAKADVLAKDRLASGNFPGDLRIGEFILYDRRLTPDERRATTAYLMKKWLGKELPGTIGAGDGVSSHPLSFADGADVVVDSDSDVNGLKVSGGSGAVVKRGEGAVSLASIADLNSVASISVEAGSLSYPVPVGIDDSDALFHFDASDTGALTFVEVANGNGTVTTNVTHWLDVRRNGVFAHSSLSASEVITSTASGYELPGRPQTRDPTYNVPAMPDGVRRPTVDFGDVSYSAGAGMQFSEAFTSVREIHTVFSDADSAKGGMIVGGRGSTNHAYDYLRAYSSNGGALLADSANAVVRNGYIAVDGEEQAYTYRLPSGFHLISFAPTGDSSATSMSQDRTSRAGGSRISEQIAFSAELSAERREYLLKYLMWKWGLGANPERPLDASFDSLAVASGAALDLGGEACVSASALEGSGTISAGAISGVTSLVVPGEIDCLTVAGTVEFANDAVSVAFPDGIARLGPGEYVVFSADKIANANVLDVTFTGAMNPRRRYFLRQSGDALVLKVIPLGMSIILR